MFVIIYVTITPMFVIIHPILTLYISLLPHVSDCTCHHYPISVIVYVTITSVCCHYIIMSLLAHVCHCTCHHYPMFVIIHVTYRGTVQMLSPRALSFQQDRNNVWQ